MFQTCPKPLYAKRPRVSYASSSCHLHLHEVQKHEEAECNEASQDNSIPPLLGGYPSYQTIQSRYLTRRTNYPPINARQRLPLQSKALIHRISLAQNTIRHIVAIVYPSSLIKHILRLCILRITRMVGINIISYTTQKVRALSTISQVVLQL